MADDRFEDKALVTCEALRPEIERLRESGELEFQEVFYVHPGSHERPWIIEEQLPERLAQASQDGRKVLVALGTKCFFDLDNPERNIDALIESTGVEAKRVNAEDCVDMLADKSRRTEIANGRSIYWMTPGWMMEREKIFEGWDQGKVNETFPRNDAVVLLDALDSGKVAAAGLDVFYNEPKVDIRILEHDRISISPHIAGLSKEAQHRIGQETVDIIIGHSTDSCE